jgi:dolichol-phosphate mannosyltransferase
VFTATYNEVDNIATLVDDVFAALPGCDLLVVDDSSPDGTGPLLDELARTHPQLTVIHRPGKHGLGTAHKLAIKYALAHGYDALVTMDADYSHDPGYLPELVRNLERFEFVIGSRYMPGGSCEYPPSRIVLSRTANLLTRGLLQIPLAETTTSYRGFRRSLLERMNVDAIEADGYSFFVEAIYQVACLTRPAARTDAPRIAEFPIRFVDRRAGETKISRREIWRGMTTLGRLAVRHARARITRTRPGPTAADRPIDVPPCTRCGCAYFTALPAGARCLGCGDLSTSTST